MTFPANSAFDTGYPLYRPIVDRGTIDLPKDSPKPVLGATKKLGVVEIPVEQLENWYHVLDGINNGLSGEDHRVLELRDAVYGFLH